MINIASYIWWNFPPLTFRPFIIHLLMLSIFNLQTFHNNLLFSHKLLHYYRLVILVQLWKPCHNLTLYQTQRLLYNCHNIALDNLKCIKINVVTIITMVTFNNLEFIAPCKIQNDDSHSLLQSISYKSLLLFIYCLYISHYYMTNSYRPGIKKFDWFKAGL